MNVRRRVFLLFVLFACAPLLWMPVRAATRHGNAQQEPVVTLVVTTPTPTALPVPSASPVPAATPAVSAWSLPISALAQIRVGLPAGDAARVSLDQSGGGGYIVAAGDTLLDAALELGLDVEEVGCTLSPSFDASLPLVIGDRLMPLSIGVLCVQARPGDTIRSLAEQYSIAPESIVAESWNELALLAPAGNGSIDQPLPPGRYVRLHLGVVEPVEPGAGDSFLNLMLAQPAGVTAQDVLRAQAGTGGARRRDSMAPVTADWPYGSGAFRWPTYGFLTQGYRFDHRALDIAAPTGAPVTAADRGVVVRAGWSNQGYGRFVIIDHNIDYLTLYAHMDLLLVVEGEVVAQGQVLGTVGTTGNSTGPHLHFELRDFGRLVNPLEYLIP